MSTVLCHGSYFVRSRFRITQHWYGCTDCESEHQGYAEVLEMYDSPARYHPIVLCIYVSGTGSAYIEFDSVEEAIKPFRRRSRKF